MPAPIPRLTPTKATLERLMADQENMPSVQSTGGFWTRLFVVDSRTGQPEFSKILAFFSVIMLLVFQSFALFVQHAAFDPTAFAKAVAWMFGGLATHLGVSEFFRQRFDQLNGIRRDGQGGFAQEPPMMQPPAPDAPEDNTPPSQ